MGIVIKAENVSKYYKLGVINNGALFKDIQTWWALRRGKNDPHSCIGQNKYDATKEGFWALNDLNFDIIQGDRVGIIGKNGAGKSTLLKILSRITAPTEGQIKIKGRIASLLEVGTGFHGELTGRENIYLNGAILGMKRREVARKLDEIITFSEIEQHIDTPIKRYSSGMYVRLAFAVAAHLDSEILIADEVLAVGDASFQKKALGKMNELSTGQGRTVLFVSHQMNAVKTLCNKGIVLEKGRIVVDGSIDEATEKYLYDDNESEQKKTVWVNGGRIYNKYFTPQKIELLENDGTPLQEVLTAERSYVVKIEFDVEEVDKQLFYELQFWNNETYLFSSTPMETQYPISFQKGKNIAYCSIPKMIFNENTYRVEVKATLSRGKMVICAHDYFPKIFFSITSRDTFSVWGNEGQGLIKPELLWETEKDPTSETL